MRHQTHGDLDEAKLIEGLTGERAIYKRRGEKEPEVGQAKGLEALGGLQAMGRECSLLEKKGLIAENTCT